MSDFLIRGAQGSDAPALQILYKQAFPDEDLFPLVLQLLDDEDSTFNIVVHIEDSIVGHIAFSKCFAEPDNTPLSLLGPLAVHPEHQRKGLGGRLIEAGFERLKEEGGSKLLVLGDPNYYGRFGFMQETDVQPAYPIPDEWASGWQSLDLTKKPSATSGRLQVSKPWRQQELWS